MSTSTVGIRLCDAAVDGWADPRVSAMRRIVWRVRQSELDLGRSRNWDNGIQAGAGPHPPAPNGLFERSAAQRCDDSPLSFLGGHVHVSGFYICDPPGPAFYTGIH
jgi:hypothetical protein